jgi:MFS family permease
MFSFPWWMSLCVGFLSLSQEILWVRAVAFLLQGATYSFSIVLFLFLLGIAIGADIGKQICERNYNLYAVAQKLLFVGVGIDFLGLVFLSYFIGSAYGLLTIFILIVLTAGLKSILFPIAHHLGSNQKGPRLGRSVSKVYFGNIIGSSLGPIITGYVLLNLFNLGTCMSLVTLGAVVLAIACGFRSSNHAQQKLFTYMLLFGFSILCFRLGTNLTPKMANLSMPSKWSKLGFAVRNVVENRHGIIHTLNKHGEADVTLGGGIYDGRVAIDMIRNVNGLDRCAVMFSVHPNPERVLIIGLSTGAWARFVMASPRVREIC